MFPVKLFYNPIDKFEAQTTLRVSVEDRTGRIIMNETFRSQRHTRDNDNSSTDTVPIAGALQSSFVDAIQRVTLGVVGTTEYRTFARKGRKSPDQSQPAEASVVSDVDDAPKVSLPTQKNQFAVLIGIEQYRQQLPKVEFAAHDAQIMREYLVKTLGYPEENVVTLLNQNATKTDIEKYIEQWLPNHVDKNSSVFVFYSGHGAPNAKTNEGYLLPYGWRPHLFGGHGVSAQTALRTIRATGLQGEFCRAGFVFLRVRRAFCGGQRHEAHRDHDRNPRAVVGENRGTKRERRKPGLEHV